MQVFIHEPAQLVQNPVQPALQAPEQAPLQDGPLISPVNSMADSEHVLLHPLVQSSLQEAEHPLMQSVHEVPISFHLLKLRIVVFISLF